MRLHGFVVSSVIATFAGGCSSDDLPSAVIVEATDALRFEPSQTRLAAGGQVTWRFGDVAHNVFFTSGDQAPADIPDPTASTSVTRMFPDAGTYTYECQIHPGMGGSVAVAVKPPDDPSGPY